MLWMPKEIFYFHSYLTYADPRTLTKDNDWRHDFKVAGRQQWTRRLSSSGLWGKRPGATRGLEVARVCFSTVALSAGSSISSCETSR